MAPHRFSVASAVLLTASLACGGDGGSTDAATSGTASATDGTASTGTATASSSASATDSASASASATDSASASATDGASTSTGATEGATTATSDASGGSSGADTTAGTTTGGVAGTCGWDDLNADYACGFSGAEPTQQVPIDCPPGLVEGMLCDGLDLAGCCDPNGDNWYCEGQVAVLDDC